MIRLGARHLLCLFTAISLAFSPPAFAQVAAQPQSLCTPKGYQLLFFNGVWNMPDAAHWNMKALQALLGDNYHGSPLKYDVMYNETGKYAGATALQDIAEVFVQRADEIDNSGELARHFELLWEVIADGGGNSLWQTITRAIPAAAGVYLSFRQDIDAKFAAAIGRLLSDPPTQADYAAHNNRLDTLQAEGQKLLFVAHSQGNLFANHAYDYIQPKIGAENVAVVHVAPASPTLRGDYLLANIDLVINSLRILGISSVPAVNLALPFSARDPSGHMLIDTYLDASRSGRARVYGLLSRALAQLQPPAANMDNAGFFTITLTWDGTGDVDLHVFEPGGAHVYYADMQGHSGYLDTDNVVANGPEHYYASCDPAILETGTYSVGINNYARATGRTATVEVSSSQEGVIYTSSLGVGPVRGSSGNATPIPVVNVVVVKDSRTGAYSVMAQ